MTNKLPLPTLSLCVQYALPAPLFTRWRVRRWILRTIQEVWQDADPAEQPAVIALTLRFVDTEEGRTLNAGYRERDYATNVLTFEYGVDPEGTLSGDIVICLPVLEREALEQGKTLLDHGAHLIVHGALHAMGYDHIDPEEAEDMEALETLILARLGIADPYTST